MTGWRSRAACRPGTGIDPEVFFPVSTVARQQIAEAVAVCRACPVRTECLDDAVATRDVEFGIRAGLMPAARRELAAPRARADRDARAAADAARVVPRLSPRMWSAITAADGSGVLAARTPTEVRRSLFHLRVAAPTVGSRVRWADRLNATGMALRAQRLCAASERAGGCEDPRGGSEALSGRRSDAQCVRSADPAALGGVAEAVAG